MDAWYAGADGGNCGQQPIVVKTMDPVDDVQVAYDYFRAVSTVTDGLGHVTGEIGGQTTK